MTIRKLMLTVVSASSMVLAGGGFTAAQASTVEVPFSQQGHWAVLELAQDSATGHIESFKVDRDLVAWTERDDLSGVRYLRAWNGDTIRLLAIMDSADWSYRNDFYEPVSGNYDVADGVVTWIMSDGNDTELFCYRNGEVERLTHNSYDDVHPVTDSGRIAWTSFPGGAYNLQVAELDRGIRTVASYHVMNYALSGDNLYWLNRLPNEDWFRVFADNGLNNQAIGKGDDRPMTEYFVTDGDGSAAWEYSTKKWEYDKREIFVSNEGVAAKRVLLRDVPPNVTRLEDVRGPEVLINTHDLLTSQWEDVTVLQSNGNSYESVTVERVMTKIRFSDDASVRHQTPNTSSPLIIRYDDGYQDMVSLSRVRHELFEADANTVAAAYHEDGGLLLHRNREVTRISTDGQDVRELATGNDTTAFVYGPSGSSVLAVATPLVLVGNSAGAEKVSGRLVKSVDNQSVYLATTSGDRYLFPAEAQFYNWYDGFGSLQTISADELSAMPLRGTVLHPAKHLVKTPSSPEVYVIGSNGELHWVTDGLALTQLYGSDWNSYVYDLPASFFTAYRVGVPVTSSTNFYTIAITE